MKKILYFLKDYKKESILAPLFKMLEASFELLVPLVMAYIIDVGIVNRDKKAILILGGILVFLGVIGLLCSITAQYYSAKAGVGIATKLRHALFEHIQGLSYTELDTYGSATMITRITSDVNQIQSGVNLVLRLFLRSPFIVFGAMIMAFTIDAKAAFVFAVTIPLLSIVVFGVMLISIPLYKKVQQRLDQVLSVTRESLTGARVVRAFNMEDKIAAEFKEDNVALKKVQLFVGRISALMNPITFLIINLAIAALVWTGAIRVDNGILTQGQVIALVSYMSQILVELIKLANLIITVTKAAACGNRVQNIFEINISQEDMGKEVITHADDCKESLAFDHVSFCYKGAMEESLTDINFAVKPGDTIGIIGGTGSGKSTLVNLIPRFYDVTKGSIRIFDKDVRSYPMEELRQRIGIVPQKAALFKGSIRENLLWGKKDADEKEIMAALELSQAKEFIEKKKEGLDYLIEQGGKNLSGGQKQRLTIARALLRNPDILILDDSASALDYATDAKLRKSLKQMRKDMTTVIVSQRTASIQSADVILVLEDGKIAGAGTHEELLLNCPVYQEIYYLSAGVPDMQPLSANS